MDSSASPTTVSVVEYNPLWPEHFCQLRGWLAPIVHQWAIAVEHVGSTSVPGLAAKPVIDLDVVIASPAHVPAVIRQLASVGYDHLGDLGIEGREAFRAHVAEIPAHNLYVCPQQSIALRNHLTLRNHLRSHFADRAAYAALKRRLAAQFPNDIASYVAGKSDFIAAILGQCGFAAEHLHRIRGANRP